MRAMPTDLFDWMLPFMLASFLVPVIITVAVIAVIVWAIRRNSAPQDDPAVAELKARYARGEIDPAEFQVRLRDLQESRD